MWPLSLLVLRVTNNSSLALGLVSLAQAVTFIICSLIGGGLADRFDKRKLLLVTQTILAIASALLGLLTLTGHIALWSIVLLMVVYSAVLSVDQPTRGALVPLLVPKELLTNAVALQAVAFSSAAAVGPALAGFLSGPLGLGGIFLLNALSFAGMLAALWFIKLSGRAAQRDAKPDFAKSLKEAYEVIKTDAFLPWIISGYGAVLFFGPSISLILPLFARQQLQLDNIGLGWLFTAVGLGTIVGGTDGGLVQESVASGRGVSRGRRGVGGLAGVVRLHAHSRVGDGGAVRAGHRAERGAIGGHLGDAGPRRGALAGPHHERQHLADDGAASAGRFSSRGAGGHHGAGGVVWLGAGLGGRADRRAGIKNPAARTLIRRPDKPPAPAASRHESGGSTGC